MYVIYLYNNMYVYLKQTSDSVFLYFFPFLVVIFQNLFNLTNKKKWKCFLMPCIFSLYMHTQPEQKAMLTFLQFEFCLKTIYRVIKKIVPRITIRFDLTNTPIYIISFGALFGFYMFSLLIHVGKNILQFFYQNFRKNTFEKLLWEMKTLKYFIYIY